MVAIFSLNKRVLLLSERFQNCAVIFLSLDIFWLQSGKVVCTLGPEYQLY